MAKSELKDWLWMLNQAERRFREFYWSGRFTLAGDVALFYNKLLHAVQISHPEWRR
jgi:hypothetical protein